MKTHAVSPAEIAGAAEATVMRRSGDVRSRYCGAVLPFRESSARAERSWRSPSYRCAPGGQLRVLRRSLDARIGGRSQRVNEKLHKLHVRTHRLTDYWPEVPSMCVLKCMACTFYSTLHD